MALSKRLGFCACLVGGAMLAAAAGCGEPAYTSLLNHRLDELRAGAPFRVLYGPTTIPDTPIQVRLPMTFRKSYLENSPHSDDGDKIRADRLQPPFLQLPGFRMCYEGNGSDPNAGRVHFYCYLWAIPSKPGDAEKIAADVQAKLNATFKDAKAEWQAVDAATPEGKGLNWRKIGVEAPMPYPSYRHEPDRKKMPTEEFPSKFELWMYDSPNYVILIGWRTPTSSEGVVPASSMKNALPILGAELPDKMDMSNFPVLTAGSLVIAAPEAAPAP
jgi:hypothetical protein